MGTDYRQCKYCRERIIFAASPTGGKLPPVDYLPDPAGPVAITHLATGGWTGRFLARGEQPAAPAKTHAVHSCEGMDRHRQRGKWTSAQAARNAGRRRRRGKPATPEYLPGMARLGPGGSQ